MTDRELVDALRSTTSRSKRKLLDAAADRIESTIRVRTTIDYETIYGFPARDLVVAATVMRMIMDEVKYYPARMNHPNLCRPLTNADRIRQMSDEELAMCLYEIGYDRGWGAPEGTLEWLQRPAEVTK